MQKKLRLDELLNLINKKQDIDLSSKENVEDLDTIIQILKANTILNSLNQINFFTDSMGKIATTLCGLVQEFHNPDIAFRGLDVRQFHFLDMELTINLDHQELIINPNNQEMIIIASDTVIQDNQLITYCFKKSEQLNLIHIASDTVLEINF